MRGRRSLEKITPSRRTKLPQSHSAYKSDRTKDGHDQKVDSRSLSINADYKVTAEPTCGEQTCTSPNGQSIKDDHLEKLRHMNVLQMKQICRNDMQTPASNDFNKKDSLPVRKRSNFKLPMKAFMTWERKERPKMSHKFPNTSRKEMSTLLGLMWRRMGTGEKRTYYLITDRNSRHREEKPFSHESSEGQQSNLLTLESQDTSDQHANETPEQSSVIPHSSDKTQLLESLDKSTEFQTNNNNANFETKPYHQISDAQTRGPLCPKVLPDKHLEITSSCASGSSSLVSQQVPAHDGDMQNQSGRSVPHETTYTESMSSSTEQEQTQKKTNVCKQKKQKNLPIRPLPQKVRSIYENRYNVIDVERRDVWNAADSPSTLFPSNNQGIPGSHVWSVNNDYRPQYNPSISSIHTLNGDYSISGFQYVGSNQSVPALQSVNGDPCIQNIKQFDYNTGQSVNNYIPHLMSDSSSHSNGSVNNNNSGMSINGVQCLDNNYSTASIQYNKSDTSINGIRCVDSDYSVRSVHSVDSSGYISGANSSGSGQSISGLHSAGSNHSITKDCSVDKNNFISSGQSGSDNYQNSSNTSMSCSRLGSGYYPVISNNSQLSYSNISSAELDAFGSSGKVSNTVSNTPENGSYIKAPILWSGNKDTPESNIPYRNDFYLKNVSYQSCCDQNSKQSDASAVRHMNTNGPRANDCSEKDSDLVSNIKYSRMNLQSDTKHHTSGVSYDFYDSMKLGEFIDDDDEDDDDDDFPHLVIDDSCENQPPDSNDLKIVEDAQNNVTGNSNKTINELDRPNSTVLHENGLNYNSVPRTLSSSVNQVILPSINQSLQVTQPVQTVTYVYRKNHENVYSTTVIPSTGHLTSSSEMKSPKPLCSDATMPPLTKPVEANETFGDSTIPPITTVQACRKKLKSTKTVRGNGSKTSISTATKTGKVSQSQMETAISRFFKPLLPKRVLRESVSSTVSKPVSGNHTPAKPSAPAVTKTVQTNCTPHKTVKDNGTPGKCMAASITKAVQTNQTVRDGTSIDKASEAKQKQISYSLPDEDEPDFADVNTMCENIFNQKCLVPELGKITDSAPVATTTVQEKHNKTYPRFTGSSNTYIPSYYKKHNSFPYIRKTPSSSNSTIHDFGYKRTPTPPISSNVATSNSRMFDWNSVSSQKVNGKSDLLQELPLILQHCKENKLFKPTIIGPLSASALESMLAMSSRPENLVQTEKNANNVPVSKYVPGTREMYRDTGMGNVNKNGNIKRPMNAFMVWARSYRGHLTMLYPNESNKLVSQRLGDIWKKMTLEDKQPYYIEADRIKRQHRKDYPDWKYKPNTPKSRPEKMGTHDVLWARFIGASESSAGCPSKLSAPQTDVQSKENTPPSNYRKRNYSVCQQGNSQLNAWQFQVNGKQSNERNFSCKKIKLNETAPRSGDIGHVITLGGKTVKHEPPASHEINVIQGSKPYSGSTTLSAINVFTSQNQINHFTPLPSEMMVLPKGNNSVPYLVKTTLWNTIKPLGVPEQNYVSSNGISINQTKPSDCQTYALGSRVGHIDSGKPVHFAFPANNPGNNNPWRYNLPYRWPETLPAQGLSAQWPAPLPQCTSTGMLGSMNTAPASEATNLTNLYRMTPNSAQETALTRLVPSGVMQVSQGLDIRNPHPGRMDGYILQGKALNNNVITTLSSSSFSSVWADSASYVSSVLKSPHSMYLAEPHINTNIPAKIGQPQLAPFVRMPSTTDSSRVVTMPILSAETYKRLLKNGEITGSCPPKTLSLVPLQTAWVQSATTAQCAAVSLNKQCFSVITSSSYSVPISSEKVGNAHLASR